MRWIAVPLLLALGSSLATAEPVDFAKQVAPILESKCQPCHYPGGKMYEKLPFDKPATIVTLGEKLFSRIKDEPSRAVIRRFLEESRSLHTRSVRARSDKNASLRASNERRAAAGRRAECRLQ